MGIKDRKEKQKLDIRKQILDASVRLFVEEGFEHVTIRKIADIIEYSPTTIYHHFKDKNEILFNLHELGFAKFMEMNLNLADIANPLLRLHKMGENYIEFGLTHPEFYDFLFIQKAPMEALEQMENCDWDRGDAALNGLKELIASCMEHGYVKKGNVEAVSMAIWGMVHGLVSLAIRDRLGKLVDKEHMKASMHQSLNWLMGIMDESIRKG